jgi:hypothetical protein
VGAPLRNVLVLLLPYRELSQWAGSEVAGVKPPEYSGFLKNTSAEPFFILFTASGQTYTTNTMFLDKVHPFCDFGG